MLGSGSEFVSQIGGPMEEKRLLSVNELSVYTAMPKATVYTYVSLGRIPAECVRRVGRALRFEKEAVDRWLNGLPSGSPASAPGRR